MSDKYVDSYLRLEERASGAESKAEEYRKRSEDTRWEQCRIASEAVTVGGYTKRGFAEAVGVSDTTVRRQMRIWERWGATVTVARPSYAEAIAWTLGSTAEAETDRKQLSNAKTVLRNPEAVREVMRDPAVRLAAREAINEHDRKHPEPKPREAKGDAAFVECLKQMLTIKTAFKRLVDNLNEGRKNGILTTDALIEFADVTQLYSDAVRAIANSKGLTDEALAEWIGAE